MGDAAKAAADLIRAQDNLRELSKVGKATHQDVENVKNANKAYTEAKNR